METDLNLHLTPNQLEQYFLGHAAAVAVDVVEEHLLVCERCRAKLEETEMEIRVLRIALRSWEAAPTVH